MCIITAVIYIVKSMCINTAVKYTSTVVIYIITAVSYIITAVKYIITAVVMYYPIY